MSFHKIETPSSYFEEIAAEVGWQVLSRLGIKIRKRHRHIYSSGCGDLVTLCPFHNEKTPSMHFYEGTATFHCFGCGHNGDVFDFVHDCLGHRYNGGNKVKIYKWFKKNYNIPLPWEKFNGQYIYR